MVEALVDSEAVPARTSALSAPVGPVAAAWAAEVDLEVAALATG